MKLRKRRSFDIYAIKRTGYGFMENEQFQFTSMCIISFISDEQFTVQCPLPEKNHVLELLLQHNIRPLLNLQLYK
ncbi:unnamed protein product [Victoria cruziana]